MATQTESRRDRLSALARRRRPKAKAVLQAAGKRLGDSRGEARREQDRRDLERLVPGTEVTTPHGRHWLHRRIVRDAPTAEAEAALVPGALPSPEAEAVACLEGRGLEGALFLDLETCGFSGMPLFLTGALRVTRGKVELVQLLARDYSEEASVVEASLALLRSRPLLVTFNGKSYDLPFLRDRAVRHRLPPAEPRGHLDLLHAARRRWKHRLPDCRLQTLEARFAGRHRAADVPGSEVPDRYAAFVRGGPAAELVPILRHNLLDLLTLLSILAALPGAWPRRG